MLKDMKKEELETLSYNDIAYMLIKENKSMSTADLFKKIVELLAMPKSSFESKIGAFYTALTKDRRFLLLDGGVWDLKENHKVADLIDKEDYEENYETEDYDDEIEEEEDVESDSYDSTSDDEEVDPNEDLKDLVILDEDELNQEE